MALDAARVANGYDAVLAVPEIQAAFGYGPGSAAAAAQAARFTAAVNGGHMGNLRSIHKAKNAAGLWDTFVSAFAKGYGDPSVAAKLNALKPSLL